MKKQKDKLAWYFRFLYIAVPLAMIAVVYLTGTRFIGPGVAIFVFFALMSIKSWDSRFTKGRGLSS